MARTIRSRPTRTITFVDFSLDEQGNEVVTTEDFRQEYGRRAGLHTSKSATRDVRRAINRGDRRDARRQLRRDPESVELRQPRGRALWIFL